MNPLTSSIYLPPPNTCQDPLANLPKYYLLLYFYIYIYIYICFGGLGGACWPLVPKFAGSNPTEAVGFLGRTNPRHTFLRRGSKAVGPMS